MLRIDTTIVNFIPGLVALDVCEVTPSWVNKLFVYFISSQCIFKL